MCKYIKWKKQSVEQYAENAVCVFDSRKYVYMCEIPLEGQAGKWGLGGGAVGTAFK